MLHIPKMKHTITNPQELFNKILHAHDFTKAKNSLEAVKIMFNAVFPTLERVVDDNESLLHEQEQVLKKFAELDEQHKQLKEEYEKLRIQLQKETSQTPE